MAKKNFQHTPKPANQPSDEQIAQFVSGGAGQDNKPHSHKTTNVGNGKTEQTRRLSIDLPQSTHLRFKTACSATGRKMTREIEDFINRRITELEKEAG